MKDIIDVEALARRTAEKIGVQGFVERWNTGEGSLISDMGDLDMAFSFDKEIDRTWGMALIEAETHGVQDEFHAAFRALIQPTINETFRTGLQNLCINWARETAGVSPTLHGLVAPFDDITEWISWCLANVEWPVFARPWGEELIPDEQMEPSLRHALAQEHEFAVEQGWVSGAPQSASRTLRH